VGSTLPLLDPLKLNRDLPSSQVSHSVSGDTVLLQSLFLLFDRFGGRSLLVYW
jgi:hypothetical protein